MESSEVERILENVIRLEDILDLDASPRGIDLPFLEMARVVVFREATGEATERRSP